MIIASILSLSAFAIISIGCVERIPNITLTNNELAALISELRENDVNRASPGQIQLNFQGHTTTRDSTDNAKDRLFTYVSPALLEKEIYQKFIALSHYYQSQTGIRENEVPQKKQIAKEFLDAILGTKVWTLLYQFLHRKGHPYASDPKTFRAWIKQLWFVPYSRARGLLDTSGFEHIFLGELKNGEISGMHSWLRFYLLENNRTELFDYRGFTVKRYNLMAAVKFTWKNSMKRSGTFLIGTSPEFDMALDTLCFLSRRSRNVCNFKIEQCPFTITSYDLIQQGKAFIGTIYPTAGPINDECRRANA